MKASVPQHILTIDDETEIRELLQEFLQVPPVIASPARARRTKRSGSCGTIRPI